MKKFIATRFAAMATIIFTALQFVPSSTANAAPVAAFTSTIRAEFVSFLRWAPRADYYEYNRFALHDFDGDNIPEILMGIADPSNANYVRYDVIKFPNNDLKTENFKIIGSIDYSRYLMVDKYSGAVLSYYGSSSDAVEEINSFYISNSIIQKNNLLRRNGTASYAKMGKAENQQEFNNERFNYLGTYKELITHDRFNRSIIETVVNKWQPRAIATNGGRISATQTLQKAWQVAFNDILKSMTAPYPTMFEPYEITPPSKKIYTRYGLFDFDNDRVPELLVGVSHGTKYSFDVYKYMASGANFIGSFDSYTLMLSKFSNAKEPYLLCFDPQPELIDFERTGDSFAQPPVTSEYIYNRYSLLFNFENLNVVNYKNGLSQTNLISVYPKPDSPTTPVYKQKYSLSVNNAGAVSISALGNTGMTESAYLTAVKNYFVKTEEIPTYNLEIVPATAVFLSWR